MATYSWWFGANPRVANTWKTRFHFADGLFYHVQFKKKELDLHQKKIRSIMKS